MPNIIINIPLYFTGIIISLIGTLRSTTANLDDGVAQTKEFFIQNKENK